MLEWIEQCPSMFIKQIGEDSEWESWNGKRSTLVQSWNMCLHFQLLMVSELLIILLIEDEEEEWGYYNNNNHFLYQDCIFFLLIYKFFLMSFSFLKQRKSTNNKHINGILVETFKCINGIGSNGIEWKIFTCSLKWLNEYIHEKQLI